MPLGEGVEGDQPLEVAITPDGATAAVVCRDSDSVEFFDVASGVRLGAVRVAEEPVALALSPNGRKVLLPCVAADLVVVVDVATRTVDRFIPVAPNPYRVVPLSDGVHAVVGSVSSANAGTFSVIDWTTGQVSSTFQSPSQEPISYLLTPSSGTFVDWYPDFEVSPDDSRLVFPSWWDWTIRVYDVSTGALLHTSNTFPTAPSVVDISRSGAFAVMSCMKIFGVQPSHVRKIDLASFQEQNLASGSNIFLSNLRVTPDESSVLLGTADGTVEIVDVATGAVTGAIPDAAFFGAFEFTHDDAYALISFHGVHVFDLASQTVVATLPVPGMHRLAPSPVAHVALALSPAYHERLDAFATAGSAAHVLWSTEVGVPIEVDGPYALDLSGDQERAFVGCWVSSNLAVVDVGGAVQESTIALGGSPYSVAVSPIDGWAVAALHDVGRIAVVDLAAGQTSVELPVAGEPRDVSVSPDGRRAFARSKAGLDGWVTFIDLAGAASQVSGQLHVPQASWISMSLSPDGSLLALLGPFGLTLIDTATEQVLATVPATKTPTSSAAWSTDSRRVAWGTAGTNPVLHVVQVQSGAVSVHELVIGQSALVLAFDPTGFIYAVGSSGLGEPGFKIRVYDPVPVAQVAEVALQASGGRVPPLSPLARGGGGSVAGVAHRRGRSPLAPLHGRRTNEAPGVDPRGQRGRLRARLRPRPRPLAPAGFDRR